MSSDNPEVQEVLKRKLSYTIFPKLLHDLIISGRHSIVVSGTHGKTTTSAMGAFVLEKLGLMPCYFIGGAVLDLEKSLRLQDGKVSVVEGDEYDSAFFAKVPKFSFYAPNTLIVTSIEFDHADIYKDLVSIESEFNKRIATLPPNSTVIACVDCPNVRRLAEVWKTRTGLKVITYGVELSADFQLKNIQATQDRMSCQVFENSGQICEINLKISGVYNLTNALSIILAAREVGALPSRSAAALSQFNGVKRRQEVRLENKKLTLIEDFAHHPSAVAATLGGIAERYKGRRLIAVFEPRSNTSRRKVFQYDYIKAFKFAQLVLLSKVEQKSIDIGQELLDVAQLASEIAVNGVACVALEGAPAIATYLAGCSIDGDVVVVMSNGAFGGLIDMLIRQFSGPFSDA